MSSEYELDPLTPQEVRQSLLAEIGASKQAIEALSEENLEYVSGGYQDPNQQPRPNNHPQHQDALDLLHMFHQAPPLNHAPRTQTVAQAREQVHQMAREVHAEEQNRTIFAELPFFNAELPY